MSPKIHPQRVLEETADESVAAGARRLVWEQRAHWQPHESQPNVDVLVRDYDEQELLTVWVNPVVEGDWDFGIEEAFEREVQR